MAGFDSTPPAMRLAHLTALRAEAGRDAPARFEGLTAWAYALGLAGSPDWEALELIDDAAPCWEAYTTAESAHAAGARERAVAAVRVDLTGRRGPIYDLTGLLQTAARAADMSDVETLAIVMAEIAAAGREVEPHALRLAPIYAAEAAQERWFRPGIYGDPPPDDDEARARTLAAQAFTDWNLAA